MEEIIERDYQPYEKKSFTLSIEQLPGGRCSLLHITKGKTKTSIAIIDIEAELLINFFKFTVMPPIYETF